MMKKSSCFILVVVALTLFANASCTSKKDKSAAPANSMTAAQTSSANNVPKAPMNAPPQLPVRYQNPGFVMAAHQNGDGLGLNSTDLQMKVGATIRSTAGPQPLWEVLKRLVGLKNMTVSWASDVDQNILVDVDIAANDNFYDAIANLLRQADYFHEIKGKNIIVRNKTTKVFQIGVPAMQGGYATNVGGNFLSSQSSSSAASGSEGTVKITSPDNKFNIWDNIESNLKVILQTAEKERAESVSAAAAANTATVPGQTPGTPAAVVPATQPASTTPPATSAGTHTTSKVDQHTARDGSTFIIDKNVGLITVTAKPTVLKTVEDYLENLKKYLFRQVRIEAKIIEVWLTDNSRLGLDWSSVLGGTTAIGGTVSFGNAGQVYPHNSGTSTYANTFVSRVQMSDISFEVFLNALKDQGDTHVLANPKLTVLNGQPAILSVGKDVAYVKKVTAEVNNSTSANTTTYSAETSNVVEGVALGVVATIRDDRTLVLHLTPITTSLENLDANGDIPTTTVGTGQAAVQLGLPKVKVREMSTMVEVRDGEMLIIGGLIDSIETKEGKFVPGLGSIPVVKYLFGYDANTLQRRELVILLTPKVI